MDCRLYQYSEVLQLQVGHVWAKPVLINESVCVPPIVRVVFAVFGVFGLSCDLVSKEVLAVHCLDGSKCKGGCSLVKSDAQILIVVDSSDYLDSHGRLVGWQIVPRIVITVLDVLDACIRAELRILVESARVKSKQHHYYQDE